MSDGMLQDILEIERQIEADLRVERDKAKTWLVEQKAGIDRLAEQEIEKEVSTANRSSENRCKSARDDGAKRIREMRRHVLRLKSVPDAKLRQVVRRHLSQIFGGVTDDYPDGQN